VGYRRCWASASGLPFGALADPLSAWLMEQGLSLTSIGLFR
jgi:hypothetical protein